MNQFNRKFSVKAYSALLLAVLMYKIPLQIAQQTIPEQPPTIQSIENWTSCEEFVNNTVLNISRVVDIDWQIFYFWNPEHEETYNVRFSVPSAILVDRYKVELRTIDKKTLNWTEAELFMETSVDMSALFLKTGHPGIYRVIPSAVFDYHSLPMLLFAMKVVDPGYLGIANCRRRICYALAPVDKMPFHYQVDQAASLLQFNNPFNRSHIDSPSTETPNIPYPPNMPDDEQDEDMEVEQDMRVRIF